MSLKVIKITNQESPNLVITLNLKVRDLGSLGTKSANGESFKILPSHEWVPIRKSNCVLDVQKPQKSPIFQLDEQWFKLYKEIIIDALQITPTNDIDPFVAQPSSDTIIEYVNTLGYPCTLTNVYAMSVNSLYQPWRAILSIINMCLPGKTAGFDRPRHHSVRKDGRKTFGMPIPNEIKRAPNYSEYLEHVTKYQQYLNEERGKAEEGGVIESPKAAKVTKPKAAKQTKPSTHKAPKHTSSQPPTSTSAPTEPSKKTKKPIAMPTEPSRHAESLSLDEELALTDSESKSDKGVPEINAVDHDKGQARPNLSEQNEGQGTNALTQQNPKQIDKEFTSTAYPNVQENLKLPSKDQVILEDPTSSTRTMSSQQNLYNELNFTNQFFMEKPQEEEPGKTNTESDFQSMVMVPIHWDTSSVLLMTTSIIDLTVSQPVSTTVQAPLPTSTVTTLAVTTTTTLPPPPPQPQQSTIDQTLLQRFDLEAARQKKRKRRVLPRTPSGSPPPQPLPPPPPAGASKAPGTLGALGSSRFPPPPHPPSTGTSGSAQQQGIKALTSSMSMATTPHFMAWTISNTRYESTSVFADVENNWAVALSSTYVTTAENSLLAKTRDITTFMNGYCRKVNNIVLTQADFKGRAFKVIKAFYPDVVHLQF
nr:hypothetical protein [Tanacetum cinerariifolium]